MSQAFLKQLTPGQEALAPRADGRPSNRTIPGGSNPRESQTSPLTSSQLGREPLQVMTQDPSFARWHLLTPGEPIFLGRDPRCAIAIDAGLYPVVSRKHAVVRAVPTVSHQQPVTHWDQADPANGNGHIALDDQPQISQAAEPHPTKAATLNHWVAKAAAGFKIANPPAAGDVSSQQLPQAMEANRWQLCDLGSANGTYVNGHRLWGCQILEVGDRLQLGQSGPIFCFEYQAVSASSTTRAVPGLDADQPVTISQLFPLVSTGTDLTRKAYLIPGIITVAVVVSLFLTVGQPQWFNGLLATYLSFGAYYFVYRLCGKAKPWWLPLLTAGLTIALLSTPLLTFSLWLFRDLLPGSIPIAEEPLPVTLLFSRMLIGAGLMEELFKALPLVLLAGLARCLAPPWRDRLGIWEPLDGILLGAASAVGFTLLETLGQYVPHVTQLYVTQMNAETAGDFGQLMGLQLLIPRLLGSVAGHIAYSGYFGYFIGLSVMLPQRRWLILGVGYGTASLLHALWNVMGSYSAFLLAIVGMLSYACLVAAILKARSLSPHRAKNFATQFSKRGEP